MEEFQYTDQDYEELRRIYHNSLAVCRPDHYQARQHDLSQTIANFLLKPYEWQKKRKYKEEDADAL